MITKNTIQSIEPNIADLANSWLKSYKLNYKLVQESRNFKFGKYQFNLNTNDIEE